MQRHDDLLAPGQVPVLRAASRPVSNGVVASSAGRVGRAIAVQRSAGNAALAGLVRRHRSAVAVQRDDGLDEAEETSATGVQDDVVPDDVVQNAGQAEAEDAPKSGTRFKSATGTGRTVTGTLAQVGSQLAQASEAGSTTSQVTDQFLGTIDTDPKKIVKVASIEVTETKAMPTWTDKASAPTVEQNEWDRFFAALDAHEDKHAALDRKAYADAHKKAIGLPKSAAETALDAIATKAKADNDAFDAATQHGQTEGTKLNINLGQTQKVPPSP